MMGDKVIEVYCHMTAVSTENGTCGNGGWTLVMKTDGNEVPSIMHACTISSNKVYLMKMLYDILLKTTAMFMIEIRLNPFLVYF